MDESWIRLHRALLDSKVWTLPSPQLRVAITCLLLANWKDGEMMSGGEVVKVLRGSFVTSRQSLAEHAGVSERTIRTSLMNLGKAGFLTRTSTSRFTLISITNYASYQARDSATDQTSDQPPTSHRPATDHDRRKKEEEKKQEVQFFLPDWLTDEDSKKPGKSEIATLAQSAIDHLNAKTGKRRRVGKGVLDDVAKLAKDYTAEDFRRVIDAKVSEWKGNPDMAKFLRPSTLFRPSKFRGYHDDLEPEQPKPPLLTKPEDLDAEFGKLNFGFDDDD